MADALLNVTSYLQSEEFRQMVLECEERVRAAPQLAVDKLRSLSTASPDQTESLVTRLHECFHNLLPESSDDDQESTASIKRLELLLRSVSNVLRSGRLVEFVQSVEVPLRPMVEESVLRFQEELTDLQKIIENILKTIQEKMYPEMGGTSK